jgi:hypothetical protein
VKKLRFKVQLVVEDEEAAEQEVVELAVLEKDRERIEQLGLTLAQSKEILKTLQKHILERQIPEFVETKRNCPLASTTLPGIPKCSA